MLLRAHDSELDHLMRQNRQSQEKLSASQVTECKALQKKLKAEQVCCHAAAVAAVRIFQKWFGGGKPMNPTVITNNTNVMYVYLVHCHTVYQSVLRVLAN